MKMCYKHHSTFTPFERMHAIGTNGITEIANQMGLFENKLLSLSSLDIEYEKVNFTKEKEEINNKNWLVRYEFMEMMLRIAGEMYLKTNTVKTWHEAIKMFYDNNAVKYFKKFNTAQPWREEKLWFEQQDYIFK